MRILEINPTFQNLIPPLSGEEFSQLEANILANGCRDPLKVWKGVIVDGHNRYAICTKHNIPFKTSEIRFASKKDAAMWIIDNQLGRRNLTDAMRIKLAAHKVEMMQHCPKNKPVNTRLSIAREAGVSEQNVRKYLKIREIGDKELLRKVDLGTKKIGSAYNELGIIPKRRLLTERTVTTMYDSQVDGPLDAEIATYAPRIYDYIDKIEKLYQFMMGKGGFVYDDEFARIMKRLASQLASGSN